MHASLYIQEREVPGTSSHELEHRSSCHGCWQSFLVDFSKIKNINLCLIHTHTHTHRHLNKPESHGRTGRRTNSRGWILRFANFDNWREKITLRWTGFRVRVCCCCHATGRLLFHILLLPLLAIGLHCKRFFFTTILRTYNVSEKHSLFHTRGRLRALE